MKREHGQVIEPSGKRKAYALRFRAYGERRYVRLGRPDEGWTLAKAEKELRHVLADVERGRWTPEEKVEAPTVQVVPTFRVFASEWLARKEVELAERTVEDYRWALVEHLLPYFKDRPVNSLTIQDVDDYKVHKATEGRLSNNSVNKTITRLSQVLQDAVEYGYLAANPAAGRRRRLKGERPQREWVQPDQLMALLDAAGRVEGGYSDVARPLLATLAGAGLRIGEALALKWEDVSLGGRVLRIGKAKTEAGVREVDLSTSLVDELSNLKAARPEARPEDPVFGSVYNNRRDRTRPTPLDRQRVRRRILLPAIELANEELEAKGLDLIGKATPHSLRRTYASIQLALKEDPVWVAEQLGHTEARFTMDVYAHAVKRRSRLSEQALKEHDRALRWAQVGTNVDMAADHPLATNPANKSESLL